MLRLLMQCCGLLVGTSGPVVRHTVGKVKPRFNPCLPVAHTLYSWTWGIFSVSKASLSTIKWDGTLHDCTQNGRMHGMCALNM